MSARSLIGTLFSELSKNTAIRIQTLSPVRDYVSVWDAVAAICLALQWEGQFEIFNLCSGEGISVHRLIQLAQTVFQADLPIFETGSPRPTDLTYLVGNPQKIQSQLQWQAQINLQEGLARLHSEEKTKVREAK